MLSRLVRALFVAAMAGASGARAEGIVFLPGLGVGLAPPRSLRPAQGFSGFQDRATNVSVVIAEMPAEVDAQIVARMTPDAFTASGSSVTGEAEDWPARRRAGADPARHAIRTRPALLEMGGRRRHTGRDGDGARSPCGRPWAPPTGSRPAVQDARPRRPTPRAYDQRLGPILTEGTKDVVKDGSQPHVVA